MVFNHHLFFNEIPLFHAINQDHHEMVKYLLENKSQTSVQHKIALIFAAMNERGICCQILLNHGADPKETDKNKSSAYDYSCRKNNPLSELVLGSSSVPQGSTIDEIIDSLNELIEKEREKLYSEIQDLNISLPKTSEESQDSASTHDDQSNILEVYDSNDYKQLWVLLDDMAFVERRMKRFLKLLQIHQNELQNRLNARNEVKEVVQLQEDLKKLFHDQFQRSCQAQETVQKNIFTHNGIDLLSEWTGDAKNRNESLSFAIDQYSVLIEKTSNIEKEVAKKVEHLDNFILHFRDLIVDPSTKLIFENSKAEKLLTSLENQARQNCDFK